MRNSETYLVACLLLTTDLLFRPPWTPVQPVFFLEGSTLATLRSAPAFEQCFFSGPARLCLNISQDPTAVAYFSGPSLALQSPDSVRIVCTAGLRSSAWNRCRNANSILNLTSFMGRFEQPFSGPTRLCFESLSRDSPSIAAGLRGSALNLYHEIRFQLCLND